MILIVYIKQKPDSFVIIPWIPLLFGLLLRINIINSIQRIMEANLAIYFIFFILLGFWGFGEIGRAHV